MRDLSRCAGYIILTAMAGSAALLVYATVAHRNMVLTPEGLVRYVVLPLALLAALGIAWLTVGYHAVKAALADPVKALRYE